MADAEEKPAKPGRKQVDVGLDNIVSIYCNNVALTGSMWDVRLRFGQIQEADAEKLVLHHLVEVFMSPAHAKAFAALLIKKVADYERLFPTWQIPTALPPDASDDKGETPEG